jgi:transcriptional regulator
MYNPSAFRIDDRETILAFMRRYSFATVLTPADGGLHASHLPLMVREGEVDAWPVLLGHMARANPHWRDMDGSKEALVIFHGPHAYVSPSLYEVHPSVPTWNYQIVHAHGIPELIQEPSKIESLVRDLVAEHETGAGTAWRPEWPAGFLEVLLEQIVGFRIPLNRIEAKFKLSQNRPTIDRENVAAAFEASTDTVLRDLGLATREQLRQPEA